jgi:hypothetical protein
MDRRDAGFLQLALQAEVEVRGVDADEDIGALRQQRLGHAAPDPHDLAVMPERLGVAAHRELVHRIVRLEAERLHARPADAGEEDRVAARLQLRHQRRGELVAGGLAGDHSDA